MKKVLVIGAIMVALIIGGLSVAMNAHVEELNPEDNKTVAMKEDNTDTNESVKVADKTTEKKDADADTEAVTTEAKTKDTKQTTEAPTKSNKSDKPAKPATTNQSQTTNKQTNTKKPTTSAPATPAPSKPSEPTTETHKHTWKTVTDKKEWDEPVYEEREIWDRVNYWPDGTLCPELANPCAKVDWCMQHCVSCFPDCPSPDPQGRCAFQVLDSNEVVGTERVQVGTTHHPAVTHQECKTCGARK